MIDLRDYSKKVWSQRGEDGIIEKIFEMLDITTGHAVELGAWDGIKYSNVYNLILQGWHATLIESGAERFIELSKNMNVHTNVNPVLSTVNLEVGSTLNEILSKEKVPSDFDILSLDIDGCDYWVWKDLRFVPKVVVVEYNSNWEGSVTIPYHANHVWDGTQFYGASARALNELAKSKGYDLVAHVPNTNLFFIKRELNNGRFQILDLSTGFHISKNHHKPMSEEQIVSLVHNPPVKQGE
jgi:hypothetical protein